MPSVTSSPIRQLAEELARENKKAEPGIREIYWFPDPEEKEIRLVELEEGIPRSPTQDLEPFYFHASPEVPAPSSIAIIRPEEFKILRLPEGWGDWSNAVLLRID